MREGVVRSVYGFLIRLLLRPSGISVLISLYRTPYLVGELWLRFVYGRCLRSSSIRLNL